MAVKKPHLHLHITNMYNAQVTTQSHVPTTGLTNVPVSALYKQSIQPAEYHTLYTTGSYRATSSKGKR